MPAVVCGFSTLFPPTVTSTRLTLWARSRDWGTPRYTTSPAPATTARLGSFAVTLAGGGGFSTWARASGPAGAARAAIVVRVRSMRDLPVGPRGCVGYGQCRP